MCHVSLALSMRSTLPPPPPPPPLSTSIRAWYTMQRSNVKCEFQRILGNGQYSIRASDVIANLSLKEQSTNDHCYQQSVNSLTSDETPQHDQHRYPNYSMFHNFGVMDRKPSTSWPQASNLSGILPPHTERAVMQDRTPLTLFPPEQITPPFNPPPSVLHFPSSTVPPYTTQPQISLYPVPSQSAASPEFVAGSTAPPASAVVPDHTIHSHSQSSIQHPPPTIANSYISQ